MVDRNKDIAALCNLLEKRGALKNQDSESLKKLFSNRSDITFEDFLLEEGIVSLEDLLAVLGDHFKIPAIDVRGLLFEHHLVTMFPKDEMLRNYFIPYEQDEDVLIVIAAYPQDDQLLEIVGRFVSYDVAFMIGYARDIIDAVEEFYDESITEVDLDLPESEEEEHDDLQEIFEED